MAEKNSTLTNTLLNNSNQRLETCIKKIFELLIDSKADSDNSINNLTALCGESLSASCVFSNRLEKGKLVSIGQWNVPSDYKTVNLPNGQICFDIVCNSGDDVISITNLQNTRYAKINSNFAIPKFKTFLGKAIRHKGICEGSLCAVFTEDFHPDDTDKEIIRIIAAAITMENERGKYLHTLEENGNRFLDLANSLPQIIFELDSKGNITYANDYAFKISGYRQDDLNHGLDILKMLIPQDRKRLKKNILQIQNGETHLGEEYTALRKDGSACPLLVYTTRKIQDGQIVGLRGIAIDITERKNIEKNLETLSSLLNTLMANLSTGIIFEDQSRTIKYCNPGFGKLFGIPSLDLVIGTSCKNAAEKSKTLFVNPQRFIDRISQIMKSQKPVIGEELELIDGRTFERDSIPVIIDHDYLGQLWQYQDITERKNIEKAIRESEKQYRQMIDTAQEGIWLLDKDAKTIFVNKRLLDMFGYKEEEMIGKSPFDFMDEESRLKAKRLFEGQKQESGQVFDLCLEKKSGAELWAIISSSRLNDNDGNFYGILGMLTDITDRKRIEIELQESEERYRTLFENAQIGIYRTTPDGHILAANPALVQMLGFTSFEELAAYNLEQEGYEPDYSRNLFRELVNDKGKIRGLEAVWTKRDHTKLFVSENAKAVQGPDGKVLFYEGTVEDITRRKRSMDQMNAFNQVAIVTGKAKSTDEFFVGVSDELKKLELSCAFMLLDPVQNKLYTKYLSFESTLLNKIETLAGIKHEDFLFNVGNLIHAQVFINKKSMYIEKTVESFREELPKNLRKYVVLILKTLGISKVILAPLIAEKRVVGVFCVMGDDLYKNDIPIFTAFAHQLSAAWEKTILVQDLKFSLKEREIVQKKLNTNLVKLEESLDDVITAIAYIVEKRDPYTAGHQERVTKLAITIAQELRLSKDQMMAIKTSGLVHDIGKISIPSEILSKPGALTQNEFRLLRSHPKDGFEILRKIHFPWPVAEIVYQHHERINGSGYPRGLKGDDICIEAKILAVADVVEAMISHRPYRPAMSLRETMEEIKKNKNILYDEKVVDACLKIFKKGEFIF